MKIKSDKSPKKKYTSFCENIVLIEEEWSLDMNLADGVTFPPALIKRAKIRINQINNFPYDTNQCIFTIIIYNGWKT